MTVRKLFLQSFAAFVRDVSFDLNRILRENFVSFGAVPAVLVYMASLHWWGGLGWGVSLAFAVANVMIRMLSKTEPTARILFYYHVGGVILFTAPAIWTWVTPVGIEWVKMIGIGALTTFGIFCFMRAFSIGETNAVGPAENLRLIYAALFGFFLFGEVPSFWTAADATIIVASTYYIARVEARGGH